MEHLWEKDHTPDAEYVDIFAVTRKTFNELFDEWDKYIDVYNEKLELETRCLKDNENSRKLLNEGHDRFRDGNYRDALEKYNLSLCYAKTGTESESLAYTNRSACFMQMQMFTNALVDIELALQFKQPSRVKLRLLSRRAECQGQLMKSQPRMDTPAPKLSLNPNKNFPCMANVLEIQENAEFGRHIVANCDIDVGETVIVSDTLSSATVSNTLTSCRCCNKIEGNFIPCPYCPDAMFCYGSCDKRQGYHYLECGSIFHVIGDTNLKLPIQTILMAIGLFPTIDKLMYFVSQCIKNPAIPESAKDMQSRYGLFLRLSRKKDSINEERIYPAYQVYTILLKIPKVNDLFDTDRKRIFLMHLTLHHSTVILQNQFRENKDFGLMQTDYIYDVLSLINHSCSPNLFNCSCADDVGYCITVRPIWKGDQVFINYLGNDSRQSTVERQQALKTWDFECKCERCKHGDSKPAAEPSPTKKAMKSDKSFQYITLTCRNTKCKATNTENGKRTKLKQECKKFLRQFGHLKWSPEIQIVTHCFTLH